MIGLIIVGLFMSVIAAVGVVGFVDVHLPSGYRKVLFGTWVVSMLFMTCLFLIGSTIGVSMIESRTRKYLLEAEQLKYVVDPKTGVTSIEWTENASPELKEYMEKFWEVAVED